MTRHLVLLVVLFGVGLLSGCGNKGPLFLPAPAVEDSGDEASRG